MVAEGRVDAKVLEMLLASADLPPPLCPQMPIMKGPGNDDDSGAEGRKGFKWHVCTQLQRNRHGAPAGRGREHQLKHSPSATKLIANSDDQNED